MQNRPLNHWNHAAEVAPRGDLSKSGRGQTMARLTTASTRQKETRSTRPADDCCTLRHTGNGMQKRPASLRCKSVTPLAALTTSPASRLRKRKTLPETGIYFAKNKVVLATLQENRAQPKTPHLLVHLGDDFLVLALRHLPLKLQSGGELIALN